MKYEEKRKNVFDFREPYYLVQCISADFKDPRSQKAGVAVDFNKYFHVKSKLIKEYPDYKWIGGDCLYLPTANTLNLITKPVYYGKPSEETFNQALRRMKEIVIEKDIQFIASPCIGAGLDRLSWGFVRNSIQDTFNDLDISWTVCRL